MGNDNLKDALKEAGLTVEAFAEIVQVDPKTVGRWLTGVSTPYPRHRANIARILERSQSELWPETTTPKPKVPAKEPTPELPAGDSTGEVIGSWAHSTDSDAPDLVELISTTDGPVDLLDNGRGIEITDKLAVTLLEHTDTGLRIRLLTNSPGAWAARLVEHPRVKIRVLDTTIHHCLLRVGQTMILTLQLALEGEQSSPVLELQRAHNGGLFDRLTENFQTLWEETNHTITRPQDLETHLTNTDQQDDDDEQLYEAGGQHRAPQPLDPARAQRRWPRQPR